MAGRQSAPGSASSWSTRVRIRRIQQLNATTFRIQFQPQQGLGAYHFTLGPDIRNLTGGAMYQDGNGVAGEATDDQFEGAFELVPRTFVFFFLGHCGQTGEPEPSGMERLQTTIRDAALPGVFAADPLGWLFPEPRCRSLNSNRQASAQMAGAQNHIRRFLSAHQYDRDVDQVVLIGHSYGGNLAYELTRQRAAGRDPVEGLVTFDSTNWERCSHTPLRLLCDQSNVTRSAQDDIPRNNVLNFVQRNQNVIIGLRGYEIDNARNDEVLGRGPDGRWGTVLIPSRDDTTHTLIDDDWSPGEDGLPGFAGIDDDGDRSVDNDEEIGWPRSDDRPLGIYEVVLNFLRRLATG